ncbi:hypothetical protein BX600DRAFT_435917 [Xylariales sp. PMI_506]|nr:hypothetical protein BX600DRAFT_435917 [Xylariales sp. PMI_506]
MNALAELFFNRSEDVHDLFLVHGFRRSEFRDCQVTIENLVASESKKSIWPVRSRVFSFDLSAVLHGGLDSLMKESQKLRRHLLQLYETSRSPSSSDFIKPAMVEGSEILNRDSSRRLLFITHGLGSWIVEEVLAAKSSRDIGFRCMGIIHIDRLDRSASSISEASYLEYLQDIRRIFNISQRVDDAEGTHYLAALASSLRDIDENFRLHEARFQKEGMITELHTRKPRIFQRVLPLWYVPTEDNSDNQLQVVIRGRNGLPGSSQNFESDEDSDNTSEGTPSDTSDDPVLERVQDWMSRQDLEREDVNEPSEDNISIFSGPARHGIQQSIDNRSRIFDLARSFFHRSDLKNAERLFLDFYSLMLQSKTSDIQRVQIRMQIMSVRIYLGKYKEAKRDLDRIKSFIKKAKLEDDPQGIKKEGLQYDRHRWLAIYKLRTGQWYEAAMRFEKLAERSPGGSRGEVYRDLAMAYAYLGHYVEARRALNLATNIFDREDLQLQDDQHSNSRLQSDSRTTHQAAAETVDGVANARMRPARSLSIMKADIKTEGIRIASAEIDLLEGGYKEALESSSTALERLSNALGRTHLKTLTAANIRARSLAYNGLYGEAETLCLATLETITKNLDRKHPLCLDAMQILVYIFRGQSRFAEAIGTGRALCKLCTDKFEPSHPETLRAEFQLAAAQLANGDYLAAERSLRQIKKSADASQALGRDHPETLIFQSQLSQACYLSGQTVKARELAIETAISQLRSYIPETQVYSSIEELRLASFSAKRGAPGADLYDVLQHVQKFVGSSEARRFHPTFVSTIRTLVQVELSIVEDNPSEGQLQVLEKILLALVSEAERYPEQPMISTSLKFSLALLLKVPGESFDQDRLARGIVLLETVTQAQTEILGDSHMDTLCAYRELIIANCMYGLSSLSRGEDLGISLEEVEEQSLRVYSSLESRLGSYHPETIRSRLWCLTLKLLNSSTSSSPYETEGQPPSLPDDVAEEVNDIFSKLQSQPLREQRFIESLRLERTVIGLLISSGFSDKTLLDVLEGTLREVNSAVAKPEYTLVQSELFGIQQSLITMSAACKKQFGPDLPNNS